MPMPDDILRHPDVIAALAAFKETATKAAHQRGFDIKTFLTVAIVTGGERQAVSNDTTGCDCEACRDAIIASINFTMGDTKGQWPEDAANKPVIN